MPPFPRKGAIYRASLPVGEAEILILSADEANAVRKVVLFCELFPTSASLSLEAPTNVLLSSEESGLPEARIAHVGSVYTLPKTTLLELLGQIRSRDARRRIDFTLELSCGLRPWVE